MIRIALVGSWFLLLSFGSILGLNTISAIHFESLGQYPEL